VSGDAVNQEPSPKLPLPVRRRGGIPGEGCHSPGKRAGPRTSGR
jgi:hypothetical protein